MNLIEKLKTIPKKSGVYLFKDSADSICYVGKAKVLANRVKQYFQQGRSKFISQKHYALVNSISDVDYIITLTEKDALSLEANLIKKYNPKYNILLKDDKHAPFIRIDFSKDFPNLEVSRKVEKDGAKYFGPYFGDVKIKDVLSIIQSAFGIRVECSGFTSSGRACLNYHIGLCLAPCDKKISKVEYRKKLDKAVDFLSGKDNSPALIIERKMQAAIKAEQFEQAIIFRSQLGVLAALKKRTLVKLESKDYNVDAVVAVQVDNYYAASVCIVRNGKMMGVINFDLGYSLSDVLEQFISRYYESADIPDIVLLESEFDNSLSEYLSELKGKKVCLEAGKIGMRKKLLKMAEENVKDFLEKRLELLKRKEDSTIKAHQRLLEILGVSKEITRIECYDISHLSGQDTVASRVVFINGEVQKSLYRRYKLKEHKADDYNAVREVIYRRFVNSGALEGLEGVLIVVDGGKGQLSAAVEVRDSLGLVVPIVALAEQEEHIFIENNPSPIVLEKRDSALKLLQNIRDEAHRFAHAYNSKLRHKRIKN